MIEIAFFLALLVNVLVDKIFKPIRSLLMLYILPDNLAWLDFVTPFVAWIAGGVAAWYADINILATVFPSIVIGRICTSILIGGGAGLLHDIVDKIPSKGREFWAEMYGLSDPEPEQDCSCARD